MLERGEVRMDGAEIEEGIEDEEMVEANEDEDVEEEEWVGGCFEDVKNREDNEVEDAGVREEDGTGW